MHSAMDFGRRLEELTQYFAEAFEASLEEQTRMAALAVGADSCSAMLVGGEAQNPRLTLKASSGRLPQAAWSASAGRGEGIAGTVLQEGKALAIDDVGASRFSEMARDLSSPRALMVAPMRAEGRIVGVLCARAGENKARFDEQDLRLFETAALLMGKAVQTQQLKALLDSRFAQAALLSQARERLDQDPGAYRNPDQLAKILAKSFYKEMAKARFEPAQIIGAASEIIEELNAHLRRHSQRAQREEHRRDDSAPA